MQTIETQTPTTPTRFINYLPAHPATPALDVCHQLEQSQREDRGQYLTPAPVARLMASMLHNTPPHISILDAGAGIGTLFAAAIVALCHKPQPPHSIHVTAYEIDPLLLAYLGDTIARCRTTCEQAGIAFTAQIRPTDFLKEAVECLTGNLFDSPLDSPLPAFTTAILNPPYRKINAQSDARHYLRQMGIETSNSPSPPAASSISAPPPTCANSQHPEIHPSSTP